MIFEPEAEERAGLVVIQNDAHQLRLECSREASGRMCIECISTRLHIEGGKQYFEEQSHGKVHFAMNKVNDWYLKIIGNETSYNFYAGNQENEMEMVAEQVDGSFLGTESSGGFIGAYIGMYASGVKETKEKYVAYDWFSYKGV